MPKRRNSIAGQFTPRLVEMQESFAYRVLSLSGHRALSRIEIELRRHAGDDNGQLPVTFDDFAEYGVHRTSIRPALAELEALGFIVITERGVRAKAAEYRRSNKFRLTTSPELSGVGPEGCRWRRFKTLEEAFAVAEAARKHSDEKKKPPVRKPYHRPVRKPYRKDQNASTETVPLHMSETVLLSISREGTPQSRAAEPARPRPTLRRRSSYGRRPLSASCLATRPSRRARVRHERRSTDQVDRQSPRRNARACAPPRRDGPCRA